MNWWLTQGRFAGTTWDCVLLCTCSEWLFPIYYPFWLVDVLTNILSDWVVPMHYAFWFVGVPRLIILIGWLIYPVHSDWVAFLLSVSSFRLLSHVWLFATDGLQHGHASLSVANFWSLLRLMSVESVMPSYHLILSSPSHPAFSPSGCQILWISPLLRRSWKKYLL